MFFMFMTLSVTSETYIWSLTSFFSISAWAGPEQLLVIEKLSSWRAKYTYNFLPSLPQSIKCDLYQPLLYLVDRNARITNLRQ